MRRISGGNAPRARRGGGQGQYTPARSIHVSAERGLLGVLKRGQKVAEAAALSLRADELTGWAWRRVCDVVGVLMRSGGCALEVLVLVQYKSRGWRAQEADCALDRLVIHAEEPKVSLVMLQCRLYGTSTHTYLHDTHTPLPQHTTESPRFTSIAAS